jgi:hypothetical protein
MKALSKRARLVMLLGLILPAAPGHSQQASSAGAATGPFAAQSLDGDLRRLPLAETWRAGAPVVVKHQAELARLLSDPDAWRIPSAPLSQDPIAQTSARATTAAQLGPPLFTATGIPFTGVSPPDTVGAVGDAHFVQLVNHPQAGSLFLILDKAGNRSAGPTSLAELWASGACHDSAHGDPVVLWDQAAKRWLMSQLAVPPGCLGLSGPCHLCVAVSKTAEPIQGGWWLYDFVREDFPDYPKIGLWRDAYLVGSNLVVRQGGQVQQVAGAWALERDKMLAGQPASLQAFSQPKLPAFLFQGLLPATADGELPPPGTPGLFLRARDGDLHDPSSPSRDDVLEMWEMHLSWTDPASSSLTGPLRVPLADFSSAVAPIPQGNGQTLLARAEPLMWPVTYRLRGGVPRLTGSFTVAAESGGRAGVRWFQLRRDGGWTVENEGTWAPAGAERWMSSATSDHEGNLAVLYSVADADGGVFPSVRYAGRTIGDPAGTLTTPELTIAAGTGWQSNGVWGDYGSLRLDPADGCTFWGTHEIAGADGKWDTRVAAFRFADCEAQGGGGPAPCVAGDTTLCLRSQRFDVQATWRTATGTGSAHAKPLTTDTGTFWFFDVNNVELVIKVLDGCPVNQRFWVFAAGLTDVEVDIDVRDTQTDATKHYHNAAGVAFAPLQDTNAFATCP